MSTSALAVGASVAVATASVITLLAVKGDPPVEEPPVVPVAATHPDIAKTLGDAAATPSPAPIHAPAVTVGQPTAFDDPRIYGTIGPSSWSSSVGDSLGITYPKKPAVPPVSLGSFGVAPAATTATPGNLDRAIVRRYIKRNLQKIQYCYEKQVMVTPGIKGTVGVSFSIEESGLVSNATATGVDGAVSSCIRDVVSGIEFPKPKGTGGVKITTGFTFRPA